MKYAIKRMSDGEFLKFTFIGNKWATSITCELEDATIFSSKTKAKKIVNRPPLDNRFILVELEEEY